MTPTTIPSVVPMFTLASQDLGLRGWEWIIILVVILILFGARQLPDIARGLIESIENFKAGMRSRPRRQDGDSRSFWFLVLALIAVAGALSVLRLDVFSDKQKLVLTVVLICLIGAGYWAFGRTLRKRSGR
jgi:TatA/E family protein of Tat protein translocase